MTTTTEGLANELERVRRYEVHGAGMFTITPDLRDRILTTLRHREAATAEALEALEEYACPGEPELCGAVRLKDGSCIREMDGSCGKLARAVLTKSRELGSDTKG